MSYSHYSYIHLQILICRADYSTTIVILQGYAFGNKKDLFFRSLTSLKIGLMYGNIQFLVNSPVQNRVVLKNGDFGSIGQRSKNCP